MASASTSAAAAPLKVAPEKKPGQSTIKGLNDVLARESQADHEDVVADLPTKIANAKSLHRQPTDRELHSIHGEQVRAQSSAKVIV